MKRNAFFILLWSLTFLASHSSAEVNKVFCKNQHTPGGLGTSISEYKVEDGEVKIISVSVGFHHMQAKCTSSRVLDGIFCKDETVQGMSIEVFLPNKPDDFGKMIALVRLPRVSDMKPTRIECE